MRQLLPATRVEGRTYAPATVEQRMREHGVPAVSIAVIENGRVAWARSYGLADVGEGRKATTQTLFQAASISKPVAATAALTLVDDRLLALDADVNAKLRSWKVPPHRFDEKVTLRRLVSHTAGLTVHGFPGYAPAGAVPTAVQILDGIAPANTKAVRVDVAPGSQWRYSGGGYVVLQTLLSDATGKPFPQLMRERVFGPAAMRTSTVEQPLPPALRELAATAYRGDGKAIEGKHHLYPEMAAAGLWTTPSELAQWVLALDDLLAPATLKEMFTTQEKGSFGLGVALRGRGDDLEVSHGGSNEGFRGMLVYYPRRGSGVVVMTNSDNGSFVASQVVNALARYFRWPGYGLNTIEPIDVPSAKLQEYTGRYPFRGAPYEAVIAFEKGRLFMDSFGNRQEIVPVDTDEFESVEGGRIEFERDTNGRVTTLSLGGMKLPRRER
ncbi:MAG TPA: serine hydrolase [Thermoanaerobaculia bacterium]|nr:serine hydrolase [Thermoanaerobaculia bacterium]